MEGYLLDTDPQGTNIRAKPDLHSKIVKKIKAVDKNQDEVVYLRISRASNGWLYLDEEWRISQTVDKRIPIKGWISGRLVGTWIQASVLSLYSKPDKASPLIAKYPLPGGDKRVRFLGCQGEWALIECKENKAGCWLEPESQCPNPHSTCP